MSDKPENTVKVSCEFFPPRTPAGMEKLQATQAQLTETIQPEYFSVTFGAGGSTRDSTLETVKILNQNGVHITPHISCVGSTKSQIKTLLDTYQNLGIRQLVTLRGDIPQGQTLNSDLHYANELVTFIREHTGNHFHLEVAAYPEYHPESPTPQSDFDNFKRKVDAGADGAITQYFYNIDAFDHFMDKCLQANINIPVTPGIMPITGYKNLVRFSDICGAEIPRWIRKQLEAYADEPESLRAFGIDIVSQLCSSLKERNVPGLHFYTLNQAESTLSIWRNLSNQTT